MSSLSPTAPDALPVQGNAFLKRLAITLCLAAFADGLFYGQTIGISAVLFAIALAGGSLIANFARARRRTVATAGLLMLVGAIPAVEDFNALSIGMIVLALAAGVRLITTARTDRIPGPLSALADLFLIGPFRFFRDAVAIFDLSAVTRGLAAWFVPAVLGAVFVFLFASANPILEKWIGLLKVSNLANYLSTARILFWVAAMSMVWPFIHVRWRTRAARIKAAAVGDEQSVAPARTIDLLGTAAILRSLLLFNVLFAVQTVLDMIYLWGNATLPPDVSYAAYAHHGAYSLIVTALLAAGFVLAAMRPGGPATESKVIRPLVYLWVAQNVLLVISSMLRLDLYVQTYMLTHWRIAAFVWMLLVALGLLWIVARIALNRSNAWLVDANLITLIAMLYVCSLINFTAIIADYNVTHSREAGGTGTTVDIHFLTRLGPQAVPAIDRVLQMRGSDPTLARCRNSLVEQHRKNFAPWRNWSFQGWRLQRYLDAQERPTAG